MGLAALGAYAAVMCSCLPHMLPAVSLACCCSRLLLLTPGCSSTFLQVSGH